MICVSLPRKALSIFRCLQMRGQWGQSCCAASCCCPSSRTSSTWRCPWWGGWPGWAVPCWPWCPSVTWPSVSVLSVSRQVGGDLDLLTSIYHSLSGNIKHHSHIKPSQQTLSWQGWIAPFQGQTKLYCKSFCFLLNFCHLKFQNFEVVEDEFRSNLVNFWIERNFYSQRSQKMILKYF